MADADAVVYSDVKFTRAKRNVDETVSSPTEATYSEVRISNTHPSTELPGSQQPAASNGGSKVTLKRVAVAVLGALLVAAAIALGFTCYKNSQTMERLQKLTDEYDAMKNVTGYENSQIMEKFQKLTDEFEAMKNVTEKSGYENRKTMEKLQRLTDEYETMKKILTDKRYLKCEEGWERHGTQCYYFSTNKLTWSKSRDECRQRGGDLVKIDSMEEQFFLQQKLREKMNHAEDKHWIGLTDSKTEGTWLWTDGSPLNESLKFWSGNEPDNWIGRDPKDPDGEDCARMGEKKEMNLNCWFDRSCKASHKSICEKCVCCGSA